MNRPILLYLAVLTAGASLAGAADAHHSFAMFDATRTVTVNGVVKDFQWSNPHVVIIVYGSAGGPEPESWSVELTSPGNLTRQGWTRQEVKPGDKVVLEINPLRDGQHGGAFKQMTLVASGRVIIGGQLVSPVIPPGP